MSNGNQKIAIITGGSRGLGRNTAIILARRGVDVSFIYHSIWPKTEASLAKTTHSF
jgi:NAD(P)-dependent dehydrogenase (short-subunit alcohol dehydrogenase family)